MRCPACGATNPDTAAWCGQCYHRFDAEPVDEKPTLPPPSANGDTPRPLERVPTEGFRRHGDEVQWQCPRCEHYNAIELQRCEVCATPFVERFRDDEPPAPRNWTAALALTAFAPGAGHLSIGRYGSGTARLLLFVTWMLGAFLLLTSGGGQGLIVAMPLLLGSAVVWGVSLIDIYRLQHGDAELLVGRRVLWLVVGVLVLLVLGLFGTVGSGAPGLGS